MVEIIDTHCHLDDKQYKNNIEDIIDEAKLQGVTKYIIPAANPKDLKIAKELSDRFSSIYFSIGVHPHYCYDYNEDILLKYADNKKCVAVGECGLDFYRLPDDDKKKEEVIKKQKDVFKKHIDLSKKLNKPLIIHSRDASVEVETMLKKYCDLDLGGVIHCFDGSLNMISLKEYGFYFGIGGVVTFNNAKTLRKNLLQLDLKHIILETDAPYLAPTPHRGKPNKPSYVAIVRDKLCEIYNKDSLFVSSITTSNATKLFRL